MEGERRRAGSGTRLSDETLACVLKYVERAEDRAAVSLVCQQWRRVDGATRKFVTVAYMYSTSPEQLTRRFSRLEGVKIKGKPRAAEYDLLVPHWGGYARPWIRELGRAYSGLQLLQLRRCQVSNADLAMVAASEFHAGLQVLHLHKCSGFSTAGLLPIAQHCRSLKMLSVEDSDVTDEGGEWLHALAINNSVLEVLNFAVAGLEDVAVSDLTLLVEKCRGLCSLKVGEIEIEDMVGALTKASALKELGAGSCGFLGDEDSQSQQQVPISLPFGLTGLSGLWAMRDPGLPMVLPIASSLKKLDLKFTLLSIKAYCQLFGLCHALEELQIRNGVGDEGMEMLGKTCKRLRRLRVEHDSAGAITQRGIVAVAQGCPCMQQLVVYVSDITNAALAMLGGLPDLTDFRLVLEPGIRRIVDLPLDDGIKLLLKGCTRLSKLAVYLRHGGLTDKGMGYIGEYGRNLKWLLLGCTGESDLGLANLAYKAQRMQRLEIRDCPFGEAGLAAAVVAMSSLKFLWLQGYSAVEAGQHVWALSRPYLHVEISLASASQPGQLIAHYATSGPRDDYPSDVCVLGVASPDSLLLAPGLEL